MNKKTIKTIAKQLIEVSNSALPFNGAMITGHLQTHDGVAYSLPTEGQIVFNESIDKVLKYKNFSQKFSSKHIESKIKSIFAKLLSPDSVDLEAELRGLIEELINYENKATVYLHVEGIKISTCLDLGRVRFMPGDEVLLDKLKKSTAEIISSMKHTEVQKELAQQHLLEQMHTELYEKCVGYVEVNAEPDRAIEIAKEEIRQAVDLLRFSSKFLYPFSQDIRIGLKGDHPKNKRHAFVFSQSGLTTKGDNVGSVIPFEINPSSIDKMKKIGIFDVSDALVKKQPNDFEKSIVRSIHWFSVALTQDETCNAFLFLIVSLESLFKSQPGNSIGGTIAESVALLLPIRSF